MRSLADTLNQAALFLLLVFAAPLAISICGVQASWQEIAIAFAASAGLLALFSAAESACRGWRN